jgi:glycosyltransferase involved in cell wall biosynthesis
VSAMATAAGVPVTEVSPAHTSVVAKPHWLYVVSHTDPSYGGLSSAVPALASEIAAQHSMEIALAAFCLPNEQHRPASLAADQITFWPASRKAWALDRALKFKFADAVREADGLHIHGLWEESTAVACKLARKLAKPYVLSAHGMLEPWALASKALKKRVYAALIERANVAGATCLHALTAAEAEQYRNFGATCPIAVVPNSVAVPAGADPELFLLQFPQLRGKRLVLFLSRLHPKKGLDLLMEAWGRVAGQNADAHLVIAGPDSEGLQRRLAQRAAELGAGHQITFTGMLAGAMKWSALAAAECYTLPSYSEGLSMALLEAMGMGLPVIATRACNMPEISASGAGWEIEARADALTAALEDLLGQSTQANLDKGRNGARLIASGYSTEQVTRQMAEVYDFVLGGPRPAHVELGPVGAR